MNADKEQVKTALSETVTNISIDNTEFLGDLLHRLNGQYPGDVGCYCIYFLNRLLLQEGECMFLTANVPHAYLDGNCVECMACSDNVVRAGLTPKFRDVDTLVDMLEYQPRTVEESKFKPTVTESEGFKFETFTTPIQDFLVGKITKAEKDSKVNNLTLKNIENHEAIYLVTQGSCQVQTSGSAASSEFSKFDQVNSLSRGSVCFVPTNGGDLVLENVSDDLILWRATENFSQ